MPLPVLAVFLLLLTGLLLHLRSPALASRLSPWLVIAALAVPLCQFAVSLLWSSFMLYDDEGYVLHSLGDFLSGGALYDRVYTQYGPFYFLFWKLGSFLGLRPEHLHGRALTLLLWLACSSGCAFLAWRLSRLWISCAAALAGSCIFLWPMASEPSHPGSLVCLLGILAALLFATDKAPSPKVWLLAGLLTASLLLTKINTGVLLLAALCASHGLALAYSNPEYRWLRWPSLLALTLLPWLLMRPLLHQPAYACFAAISSCSLLTTFLALRRPSPAQEHPPAFRAPRPLLPLPFLLSLSSGLLLILLFCLLTGTSLGGLLEGVLLAPLRFPNAFTTPINWRPGALPLALLSPLLCLLLLRLRPTPRRLLCTALVCLGAFGFLLCWAELIPLNMQAYVMSYGLSMTWLFCVPLANSDTLAPARQTVAWVLLLQVLQAFPVGGSQISWGSVLWIPLCCARTAQLLAELPRVLPRLRLRTLSLTGAALLLLLLLGSLRHAHLASQRASAGTRLELRGAESLILPSQLSSSLQILCANASLHGDLLFSFPGTYSFNLWTGLPTPGSSNATLWFRLLDLPSQARIQASLAEHPRAIILRENSTLDYLRSRQIPIDGPLVAYIEAEFSELFRLGSHSFLIHKDRKISPLGLLSSEGPSSPGIETLRTQVSKEALQPGLRVELHLLENDTSRRLFASGSELPFQILPGPNPLRTLLIEVPAIPRDFPREKLLLLLRSPSGHILTTARFNEAPSAR